MLVLPPQKKIKKSVFNLEVRSQRISKILRKLYLFSGMNQYTPIGVAFDMQFLFQLETLARGVVK